jgi:hypothetical protein
LPTIWRHVGVKFPRLANYELVILFIASSCPLPTTVYSANIIY